MNNQSLPTCELATGEIAAELRRISRYLRWWWCRPAKGLSEIKKLHAWRPAVDVKSEHVDLFRSMIYAVTGDCYLQMKNYPAAADHYSIAASYSKQTGFGAIYADLVLKQNLEEHFQTALDSIEGMRESFSARPLHQRFLGHLLSGWWSDPTMWRLMWIESRLPDQLRERLSKLKP